MSASARFNATPNIPTAVILRALYDYMKGKRSVA
jgi:hypothetical protein